jgi:cell division transport system permease protein
MKISSIEYSFIDAVKSLKRNRSLSFASIATVAATLFIFGVFLLIQVNLNLVMRGVESQLEVRVTLTDNITSEQQSTIESTLKGINGVKTVTLETKEQALVNLQRQFGDNNKSLLQGLDKKNPLPFTFIVKVDKPDFIATVVKTVKDMPGVEEVKDGKEVVNTVMTVTRTIKFVGLGIVIILLAVSFFLIGNTIKLTVYSRRREIGIMKYIGATDWLIRTPFIIEGVLLGIVGAIVSDLLLYFLYGVIVSKAGVAFEFLQLVNPAYVFSSLLWEFLLIGIVIGSSGSVFAVRKFLAV